MPLKTSEPCACYALEKPRGSLNQEIFVIIVCTNAAAAGEVVLLLLGRPLSPRTHFRIDQTERDTITITVMNTLSAAEVEQIRAELATIAGVSIQ